MDMTTIYYDSKTGNVARFVQKLVKSNPMIEAININDLEYFTKQGHLITFTTGKGNVPVTTEYFLQRNHELILSVSASGNRNWGKDFALSADKISSQYNIKLAYKFELSGTDKDVSAYFNTLNSKTMKKVIKFAKQNCIPCQEVSRYLDNKNVKYETINPFDNPEYAVKYNVKSVPTVVVIENDIIVSRSVGFKPSELDAIL